MFATDKIGEHDDGGDDAGPTPSRGSALRRPISRSRRACAARDWLYSYLLAFYRDDKTADRLEQPRVSERRRCRTCCGTCRVRRSWSRPSSRIATRPKPRRSPRRVSRWSSLRRAASSSSRRVAADTPGTLSAVEYKAFVARSRQLSRLHGRAGQARSHQHRHRRADLPRRAVRLRLLAQARLLERSALTAQPWCTRQPASGSTALLHSAVAPPFGTRS